MGQHVLMFVELFVLVLIGYCGSNGKSSVAQRVPATPQPNVPVEQKTEVDATLIKPGRGVGVLQLGAVKENILKALGGKREEYSYESPCKYTEMHWYDAEADSNGVFVYLRDDRVFQIESDTSRYRTAEGITSGAAPEDVRRHYPQLQAYVLLGSSSKVNGGSDLIYWVDRQSGIGFEFYYDSKARKRRVSKIVVFEPGSDFQPEGCVSPPQELRTLKPFSLDASRGGTVSFHSSRQLLWTD